MSRSPAQLLPLRPAPAAPPAPAREPGAPWTVGETANHLRVSTKTIARAAAAGRLKLIRFGRRTLVADQEVRRLEVEGL